MDVAPERLGIVGGFAKRMVRAKARRRRLAGY
jgi:hypothetical protein